MKNTLPVLFLIIGASCMPGIVRGATCISYATCTSDSGCTSLSTDFSDEHCSDQGQIYLDLDGRGKSHIAIPTCKKCDAGYKLVDKNWNFNDCTVIYQECGCAGCTNCNYKGTWLKGNLGYEKRSVDKCNCNTCNRVTEYRCAAGYYGSSTNGTSGCTRCPSSGVVYGTNTAGNNTSRTSCCIPANTTMSDAGGKHIFTSSCCYTN